MISSIFVTLVLAGLASADVVPTAPGPGQTFKEGEDCPFSFKLDTTGKWTNFSVDLMSGSNFAMQPVVNVFKNRDGTKGDTTYVWKCPKVTPNAPIYFYQFSQTGADTTWTTRFAIASPSGEVTAAANATQPGGAAIPWGIGTLVGGNPAAANTSAPATTPAPSPTSATTATPSTGNQTAVNTPTTGTNAGNSTTASGNTPATATSTTNSSTVSPVQSTSSTSRTSPFKSSTSPTSGSASTASSSSSAPELMTTSKTVVAVCALIAMTASA